MDDKSVALLMGVLLYELAQSDAQFEAQKARVELEVEKAFPIPITKAWQDEQGNTHIEGWISVPSVDLQQDKVEPEAFSGAMDEYFSLGAPLTSAHQMKPTPEKGVYTKYPVGHIQKAALVRDGSVFAEATHPTDAADFAHFPGSGSGVYARAKLTDPLAAEQVASGNVRGFSWTGAVDADPLPGGRYKIVQVRHWRESTIAAFPVNPGASFVAAQ